MVNPVNPASSGAAATDLAEKAQKRLAEREQENDSDSASSSETRQAVREERGESTTETVA